MVFQTRIAHASDFDEKFAYPRRAGASPPPASGQTGMPQGAIATAGVGAQWVAVSVAGTRNRIEVWVSSRRCSMVTKRFGLVPR